MIWAVLILDSSGLLLHSWIHSKAPKDILKKFEPNLIAGFISAIIQFGHEVIREPQRIDFGDIAMSFYSRNIGDNIVWFAVLSDSRDPRRATAIFLEKFVSQAQELLEEISKTEGLTIFTEDTEKKLNSIAESTLKKTTRFLPGIRSKDLNALLFSTLIMIIFGIYLDVLFRFYIYPTISITELLLVTLLGEYTIIGLFAGILAGLPKAGGFSAYIVTVLLAIAVLGNLTEILVIASSLSVWSFFIGYLSGGYINSLRLLITS